MGLREGIGEGLKAFGYVNPNVAKMDQENKRFDLKQKAALAGLIVE